MIRSSAFFRRFWVWFTDLGAYAVMAPFEPFKGFFLTGYLLALLAWLASPWLAAWPGYTALAHDGASQGPGRFLIDVSLPLGVAYVLFIILRLDASRCEHANTALDRNTVHRFPVVGASFFFVQFPLLLLCYQPRQDFVYTLSGNFAFLCYCMPWFAYLFANSFVVMAIRAQRRLAARRA